MAQSLPPEFSEEAIAAASSDVATPYRDLIHSKEPYRSLFKANTWMRAPKAEEDLVWGQGRYYDTTVARKHPYWKDIPLPTPGKDIAQLRQDLYEWGYCLVEDALSPEQNQVIYQRLVDQAHAERDLGIAYLSEAQQNVWSLVNKGDVFKMPLDTKSCKSRVAVDDEVFEIAR